MQERAALDVINRASATSPRVSVVVEEAERVAHWANISVENFDAQLPLAACRTHRGHVDIHATSAVAACRGFYQLVRSFESGVVVWNEPNLLVLPHPLPDTLIVVQSPFRHFQYFNVVSSGYTSPFWDEERWDREIDWMALHGIDMPLVLMGAEQIYREIFIEMGLSPEEIDEWEVGPAHLPWFRMGNLSGNSFDGPLGDDWNRRQEQICRHTLSRMRSLGMEPICPAFGGFVPPALARASHCPVDTTGWDWMPKPCRNYRINPASSLFVEIGRRFIQKWESKYGKGKYYISDSFNEMEIPSDNDLLTAYGDSVYRSIASANPDAVWVTQGWTFVWQYGQWGSERFESLTRNIPSDRMLVLYMSPEYDPARYWNHGGEPCYNLYRGFSGHQWAYTLLPNMGGKTFLTGDLSKYASEFPQEINSYRDSASNLIAYGITAEGVENNPMLYELIADVGWGLAPSDVDQWMRHYARCRYGDCPSALADFLALLKTTAYGRYIDHPRFGWQNGAVLTAPGNAVLDSTFYHGVDCLMANLDQLRSLPRTDALANDLADLLAMYIGGKVDSCAIHLNILLDNAKNFPYANSIQFADIEDHILSLIHQVDHLLLILDSVVSVQPLGLEQWERLALSLSDGSVAQQRNVRNARRLVTIWYGDHKSNEPVQDYAAKIWSGLVRDYYRPRIVQAWLDRLYKIDIQHGFSIHGEPFNQVAFENAFVNSAPHLSPRPVPQTDKLTYLKNLFLEAKMWY